jgi:hypothetical protein
MRCPAPRETWCAIGCRNSQPRTPLRLTRADLSRADLSRADLSRGRKGCGPPIGEDRECFFFGHLHSERRGDLGRRVNSVEAATPLRRVQHSPQGTRGRRREPCGSTRDPNGRRHSWCHRCRAEGEFGVVVEREAATTSRCELGLRCLRAASLAAADNRSGCWAVRRRGRCAGRTSRVRRLLAFGSAWQHHYQPVRDQPVRDRHVQDQPIRGRVRSRV